MTNTSQIQEFFTPIPASTVAMYYGFRTVILLVGLACIWMGYRLFVENIQQGGASVSGEIESPEGTKGKIHVGRGGPGVCFALFGAGIIIANLFFAPEIDDELEYTRTRIIDYQTTDPNAASNHQDAHETESQPVTIAGEPTASDTSATQKPPKIQQTETYKRHKNLNVEEDEMIYE